MLAFAALTGCPGPQASTPVTIGVVAPLSGLLAERGSELVDAAQLAVDIVNDAGGIGGRSVVLAVRDDASSVEGAAAAAVALADLDVAGFIGSVGPPLSRAVAEVAASRGLTLIAPSATGLGFRTGGAALSDAWPVLRACTAEDLVPAGVVGMIVADEASSLGIIADPGAYGELMGAAIEDAATAAGLSVVGRLPRSTPDDDAKLLAQLLDQAAEAIVLVVAPEAGANLVRTMAQALSDRVVPFYFTDSLASEGFVAQAGNEALSVVPHRGVLFADQGRWYADLEGLYAATYGAALRPYQAQAFDAVVLLALGLAAHQADASQPVWQGVVASSAGGAVLTAGSLGAAFGDLAADGDVDYDGASGALDIDGQGDVTGPLAHWQVVDGLITPVSPP